MSGFISDAIDLVGSCLATRLRAEIGRGCARGLPLPFDVLLPTQARVRYRWHNASLNLQRVGVEDIPESSSRISDASDGKRGISKFMNSGRSKRLVEARLMS